MSGVTQQYVPPVGLFSRSTKFYLLIRTEKTFKGWHFTDVKYLTDGEFFLSAATLRAEVNLAKKYFGEKYVYFPSSLQCDDDVDELKKNPFS